jgi:hypothetical protein
VSINSKLVVSSVHQQHKSINLSLSALGNCIAALSSSQQGGGFSSADWRAGGAGDIVRDRVRHIPYYRDSKLTPEKAIL